MAEKDKRYYWLKMKRDFFKRHDIRIIESMANGKEYVLFYLKLLLESVDHGGELRFSEKIPYTQEMLATITNTDITIVKEAIKLFLDLELMKITKDKTFVMNGVLKMTGSAVDNDNAKRQQRYRDRQKGIVDNEIVTKSNESKEKDIEVEKETEIEVIKAEPTKNEAIKEIIDYLNLCLGSSYTYKNKTNNSHISARLDEGHTVEDFKTVIDKKSRQWKNTKMASYLRPETLFCSSHFESYLNEQIVEEEKGKGLIDEIWG